MRFAIAYSKKDLAGISIVEQLKQMCFLPQVPIIELKKETIFSDDLGPEKYPELKNISFIVFASRHSSKEGRKTLSLHAPGNWRGADYGGEPGKACKTSAFVMKYLFKELAKNAQESKSDYEVTLEATHHGPIIEIPCCFIELGSSEEQWNDKNAAKIVAKTILSLQNYKKNKDWIPAISVGGPHYLPSFNKIQLNSNYAISHAIPEYCLPLTSSMLEEAEQKTIEHVKEVIVDWKGCGKSEEREKVLETIKRAGIDFKRNTEIK
jgi:D-aminoacyl-tRNA deacylase